MRAVWLKEFGRPEVLMAGEAPEPAPGPGQVLIDVTFANVTFVETQVRAGTGPFPVELPMIPGNGVGGVVTAVGSDVDPGLVGMQVVSSLNGAGGYAERAIADAAAVVAVPDGVALDSAVALLADGRTALLLVRATEPRPGEWALVEAAAGGVGTLLVQLVRAAGARVVAAAGGGRKVELARNLGADVGVDYGEADWARQVRAAAGQVDVVYDGVGGGIARSAFDLLARGGRMLSFGLASGTAADLSGEDAAARGVTLLRLPRAEPHALRSLTADALAEAAAGRLRPVIGQRVPLDRAADAHAALQSRATVGKTLLEVR